VQSLDQESAKYVDKSESKHLDPPHFYPVRRLPTVFASKLKHRTTGILEFLILYLAHVCR